MFIDSATLNVFGSWWGVFEFIVLLAIVAAVSYVGVNALQRNFTKHTPTGKLVQTPGGGSQKLFRMVMSAVDSAALESDETLKEEEYANKQVSTIIRQASEQKMGEEGLGGKKYQSLAKRVTKRTAQLLGLKLKNSETSKKVKMDDRERDMPFKTIDVRMDTSPASSISSPFSSIVKLSILDGVLPDNVLLPFYMSVTVLKIDNDTDREEEEPRLFDTFPELTSSSWPPKTNMVDETPVLGANEITFDNVQVKSLIDGVLLVAKDDKKIASIFDPRNKLKIKMEAYSGVSKVLLYDGETSISSPLPRVKEILSCKNFALVRIDDPFSPYYQSTYYSQDTLNEKYVSEYPRNMPKLTPAAINASDNAPRIVSRTASDANDAGSEALNEPVMAFVYGKESQLPVLTHELYYEEIKQAKDCDKYIVKRAQNISILRNPARPTETYMSMSLSKNCIPGDAKLMGWVIGFESDGVLLGRGGFNIVFPACRDEDSYADLDFREMVSASSDTVVLHNTEEYVGCFGDSETINDKAADATLWGGPVDGERYFSFHLRPCIVIRWSESSLPKIGAVMSSPATTYAAQSATGLLPRALSVSAGPLPLQNMNFDRVNTVVLGGDAVTFKQDKMPEKLCAVFPTLRTKTGLVDEPYGPLHSVLSRNRTTVLPVRKIVTKSTGDGHAVISVFDEETGVTLGGAIIKLEGGRVRPLFLDGARDDRPFSIDISAFGQDDKPLPIRPTGGYTGQFLNMTAPENEIDLWKKPFTYSPITDTISLSPQKTSVVLCRTTHPPVTNRGVREPFMKFCGLVPFPNNIPKWAFMGSLQSKHPRHIFVSSVRDSLSNEILNSDGSLFSPGQWFKDNLCASPPPEIDNDTYVRGEKVYAKLYLGNNALSTEIDQAVGDKNKIAWIVSETGTKMENMLITNDLDRGHIIGKWGIVVFGANPHPEEPADRYTNWRTTGRLRMVVEDPTRKLPSIFQPVTPLQARLATWSKGDPVLRKASGEIFVRLDPRIGGVCSANGLYNKNNDHLKNMTTSILYVIMDTASRKVKHLERVPLQWKLITNSQAGNITDNLIAVDRDCAAQRRLWNRTTFDHDNLVLCVKIPETAVDVDSTAMLVDHLVFACSASLQPTEKRADFYQKFVSSSDTIYDNHHSDFDIFVPFHFSTICGFVVEK